MAELNTQPVSASPTTNGLPGTLTLLGAALKNFIPKIFPLFILTLIPIGVVWLAAGPIFAAMFLGLIPAFLTGNFLWPILLAALGLIVLIIANSVVLAWMQLTMIYAIRGLRLGAALNAGSKDLLGYFKIAVISSLITLGAALLFVIPGIIIGAWFTFAAFVYIDQRKRGWAALTQSRALVQGRWWSIFGRSLLAGIVLSVPLIILTLINQYIVPEGYRAALEIILNILQLLLVGLAIAFVNELYNHVKNLPTEPVKSNKPIVITAIAGYILFPLIGYFLISSIISQLFGGSLVPGDNNNP